MSKNALHNTNLSRTSFPMRYSSKEGDKIHLKHDHSLYPIGAISHSTLEKPPTVVSFDGEEIVIPDDTDKIYKEIKSTTGYICDFHLVFSTPRLNTKIFILEILVILCLRMWNNIPYSNLTSFKSALIVLGCGCFCRTLLERTTYPKAQFVLENIIHFIVVSQYYRSDNIDVLVYFYLGLFLSVRR
jgi:hypothetical protein